MGVAISTGQLVWRNARACVALACATWSANGRRSRQGLLACAASPNFCNAVLYGVTISRYRLAACTTVNVLGPGFGVGDVTCGAGDLPDVGEPAGLRPPHPLASNATTSTATRRRTIVPHLPLEPLPLRRTRRRLMWPATQLAGQAGGDRSGRSYRVRASGDAFGDGDALYERAWRRLAALPHRTGRCFAPAGIFDTANSRCDMEGRCVFGQCPYSGSR